MAELSRAVISLVDRAGKERKVSLLLDLSKHTQNNIYDGIKNGQGYERSTTEAVLRLLRPDDFMIDVGAHVGYYTLLAATLVGPKGRVYAFEPHPETFRSLIRNILFNELPWVYALQAAAGDQVGTAPFFLNLDNEGESALWNVGAGRKKFPKTKAQPEQVTTTILPVDTLLVPGFRRPRLIKLDAEGWEMKVLNGCSRLFERIAPDFIVCEINRAALKSCGTSELELRAWFETRGYQSALITMPSAGLGTDKLVYPLEPGRLIDTRYVFNLLFSRQPLAEVPELANRFETAWEPKFLPPPKDEAKEDGTKE